MSKMGIFGYLVLGAGYGSSVVLMSHSGDWIRFLFVFLSILFFIAGLNMVIDDRIKNHKGLGK